ncbi:MarR family winged helix-turn-helix transcriptional regulator [Thermodesulfobacteriota bacterium]
MPKRPKIPTDCYIFLLGKAYQKGQKLGQKHLKRYGLTSVQYLVLEILWNNKGITAAKLGQLLVMDKATLSGILDRMENAGWIRKEDDQRDKRMIRIFPTENADNIKDNLIKARKRANDELLAVFTVEERVLLRRLLLEMI